MIESAFITKIGNNIKEAPVGILDASTEHKNHSRVKTIVGSRICFMLEIDWYYYD